MKSFNEFVSLGHSDSTADAITSYILDRHLEVDPLTRYAVECQIKDQHVTLAGEVTSKAKFDKDDLTRMVQEAISRIGYTHEYAQKWPDDATLDASKVTVDFHLGQQSPDIAQGVDADGWGDQGCIKKGALVLTTKGLVRIEDVKVGDFVVVDGKPHKVHNAGKTGTKKTIVLKTNRGRELCLTPDHLVFSKYEWIEAKDMLGKPVTTCSNKDSIFGNVKFIQRMEKSELAKKFKSKTNGDGKDLVLNKDLAYLIGFLVGDGSITIDGFFTFACHLDDKKDAIVQKIKNVFSDSHPTFCKSGVQVTGLLYRDALLKLGLEKVHSINKSVPFSILQSSKEIQCSFLRGLYDADGSVVLCTGGHGTKCCRIRLGSISKDLIQNVFVMLKNIGINASIILSSGVDKSKKIPQNHECWVIEIRGLGSKRMFSNLIGFDVKYKHDRLESYLETAHSHREELNEKEFVTEIRVGEKVDVYDLGIEDIHSFYANGILVHNCFEGMATGDAAHGFMPLSRYYSNAIGKAIYNMALNGKLPVGLDIKTLVTTDENFVERVIVAAPMLPSDETTAKCWISKIIHDLIPDGCGPDEIVINGTGSFVIHSSVGDCGTTGRKLAVNFYGIDCPIGGGAPWSKDGTKADVALNLLCRHRAVRELIKNPDLKTVYVKMACCIGKPEVQVAVFDKEWNQIKETTEKLSVKNVVQALKLDKPIYFNLCKNGLFSKVDALARF